VGQELYKLSWSQMGAEILSVFFIDGVVWIAASYGPQKLKNYVSASQRSQVSQKAFICKINFKDLSLKVIGILLYVCRLIPWSSTLQKVFYN